jgi:hypothetical protein
LDSGIFQPQLPVTAPKVDGGQSRSCLKRLPKPQCLKRQQQIGRLVMDEHECVCMKMIMRNMSNLA